MTSRFLSAAPSSPPSGRNYNVLNSNRRDGSPLIPRPRGFSARADAAERAINNNSSGSGGIPLIPFSGTNGKHFLTYLQGTLVTYLEATQPSISVWELYKPHPRVLGRHVSIPADIEEFCKPDKILSTLGAAREGPSRDETRPILTPFGERPRSPPPPQQSSALKGFTPCCL